MHTNSAHLFQVQSFIVFVFQMGGGGVQTSADGVCGGNFTGGEISALLFCDCVVVWHPYICTDACLAFR